MAAGRVRMIYIQVFSLLILFKNWHRRCFKCANCSKHLDSFLVNDGMDGEIYCKSCHAGKFGMTGYGYGQGAGTLLSVSSALLNKTLLFLIF